MLPALKRVPIAWCLSTAHVRVYNHTETGFMSPAHVATKLGSQSHDVGCGVNCTQDVEMPVANPGIAEPLAPTHPSCSHHAQPDGPAAIAAIVPPASVIPKLQRASTPPPFPRAFLHHKAMDLWMCGLVLHEIMTLTRLGNQAWAAYVPSEGEPVKPPFECLKDNIRDAYNHLEVPLMKPRPDAGSYTCCEVQQFTLNWCGPWPPILV